MVVSDSMTDYFASAHISSTIGDAMEKILREGLTQLLIVDDRSRLVGLIEESLLMETIFEARLKRDSVTRHMKTDFESVNPGDPVAEVVEKFRRRGVSEFPVTENGKLVGVLTRRQLLRALLKHSRPEKSALLAK